MWLYQLQAHCIKITQYFPKPYEPFGGDVNAKVTCLVIQQKTDIKNISHIDTLCFALKSNLTNLKTELDNLDIDKLVSVSVDLSRMIDLLKNDILKNSIW